MKKILLTGCCLLLPLSAYAAGFMDKCMQSWIGYPIDAVIKKWGYPTKEMQIAGRTVYKWEKTRTVTSSTYERTQEEKDKKGRTYYNTYISGGDTEVMYCIRNIEIDSNNKVVNAQWEGNDCPIFYMTGSSWVNPENDEWERRKQEKRAQRAGY